MYLGIYLLLFGAIVACETKEPPSLTCKKTDQSDTTCLGGAQTSAPATAATPPPSGMTPEQMTQLMMMLQQNQQTGQAFSSVNPNTTPVGTLYATTEQGMKTQIQQLKNDIIELKTQKNGVTSKDAKDKIDGDIAKAESDIRFLEGQLKQIQKEASLLGQAKNMAIGAFLQNPGAIVKGGLTLVNGFLDYWQNRQESKVEDAAAEETPTWP